MSLNAGELVTETLANDEGRPVTVYVPSGVAEAIVFAADRSGRTPPGCEQYFGPRARRSSEASQALAAASAIRLRSARAHVSSSATIRVGSSRSGKWPVSISSRSLGGRW